MSTPVLPLVIKGPGIIFYDGFADYFGDAGVKVKTSRKTWEVKDDMSGYISTRSQGGPMVDLEFTPTGRVGNLIKRFPYGPTNLVAGFRAGASILKGAVYIQTVAGVKTLWERGGVYKSPTLYLSPKKQLFGSMTISAINKIDVQPTDAAAFKAITTTAFADTTFSADAILTDIYTATMGDRDTPFDAMGARTGFEIEPIYEISDDDDDGVGIADRRILSTNFRVKFDPNNLTEAQIDELAMWQDADAILAGQSVSRGPGGVPEDLIIDSDALTATLHNAGVIEAEGGFGSKLDRNGMLTLLPEKTFTTGVANPLISLVVN